MVAREDERRLELLKWELGAAGLDVGRKHVPSRSFFPRWARSKTARQAILTEMLATLDSPIHEGLIPPYGGLVVPPETELPELLPMGDEDVGLARKAADGSSAFLVSKEAAIRGLLLVEPSGAPDLQLTQVAGPLDAVAFRRDRTGEVRIYGPEINVRHIGRQWTTSPTLGPAVTQILETAPMIDRRLLVALLEFALYVLSPWRIGATLVWVLSEREATERPIDLRHFRLQISPGEQDPSLAFAAHLLAQFDGATFVCHDGTIDSTGIHLRPSDRAHQLIPEFRGTRHTSARRASYDMADALIVTVSADGPVTVFSDGLSLFDLWFYSAAAAAHAMQQAYGRLVEDAIFVDGRDLVCTNCGKSLHIEILTVAGWRNDEEAACPVCGEVVDKDHCFDIHANLRKVF